MFLLALSSRAKFTTPQRQPHPVASPPRRSLVLSISYLAGRFLHPPVARVRPRFDFPFLYARWGQSLAALGVPRREQPRTWEWPEWAPVRRVSNAEVALLQQFIIILGVSLIPFRLKNDLKQPQEDPCRPLPAQPHLSSGKGRVFCGIVWLELVNSGWLTILK
jgi:hypothetical protein